MQCRSMCKASKHYSLLSFSHLSSFPPPHLLVTLVPLNLNPPSSVPPRSSASLDSLRFSPLNISPNHLSVHPRLSQQLLVSLRLSMSILVSPQTLPPGITILDGGGGEKGLSMYHDSVINDITLYSL